jgi:hypothetical protein
MKFSRFTSYGPLTDWGCYSTKEKELLELERKVAKRLTKYDWISAIAKVKPLMQEFFKIQSNTSVQFEQYGEIESRLKSMLEILTTVTKREVPVFSNHQPGALVGEIRTHLEARSRARAGRTSPTTAMVIHFNTRYKATIGNGYQEDPRLVNFRQMIDSGQKVLWAFDIEQILSIGDPKSNKHSVVAVGQKVFGAGAAQLKLDPKRDQYLAMQDQARRATEFENEARKLKEGDLKREELLDNVVQLRKMVEYVRQALGDWQPPVLATRTIELDFDSGHYAPRSAWSKSEAAWMMAGYEPEWSTTSKFT